MVTGLGSKGPGGIESPDDFEARMNADEQRSSDAACTCTWSNVGNANTTRRERTIAIGCVVHGMGLDPHVIAEHRSNDAPPDACAMCGEPCPEQEITLGALRICSLDCASGAERMRAATSLDDFEDAVNAYEQGVDVAGILADAKAREANANEAPIIPQPVVTDLGCWVCRVLTDAVKANAVDVAMYEGMIVGARVALGAAPVLCREHAERWSRVGVDAGLQTTATEAHAQRVDNPRADGPIATPAEEHAALIEIGDMMMNDGLDHEWNPKAIVEAVRFLSCQKDPDCRTDNPLPKAMQTGEANAKAWLDTFAMQADSPKYLAQLLDTTIAVTLAEVSAWLRSGKANDQIRGDKRVPHFDGADACANLADALDRRDWCSAKAGSKP